MKTAIQIRQLLVITFLTFIPFMTHAGAGLLVPEGTFDAESVMEGEVVEHTFTVVNPGTRSVAIRKVKPDCGCTTAQFDPVAAPGKQANITLQLDTSGYAGEIAIHTRVITDDPDQPMIILTMKARVWTPISVSQKYVVFKGTAGEALTETIEIEAGMDKPLTLETEAFDLEGKVTYRIEEVEPGRRFRVDVSNLPGPPGQYHGSLHLKTNYSEMPGIEIRIRARFRKPD